MFSCLSEGHKQQLLRRECLLDEIPEGKILQSKCSSASNVWYCMILQACVSHRELSIIKIFRALHIYTTFRRLLDSTFTDKSSLFHDGNVTVVTFFP